MEIRDNVLKLIFIFEFILFICVLILLFTELNETFPISPLFIFIIFSPLGIVQFCLTKKNITENKLKTVLMINGLSSFGVTFFAILHNLFYAFTQMIEQSVLLSVLGFLEATSFIVAIVICPIVFLITAILSVVFYFESRVEE
jgi:hypothetical protein